jgi:hypothetical protein
MRKTLLSIALVLSTLAQVWAQCIPAAAATVAGTVPGTAGTYTFTNVPTGRVIQLTVPAANTTYLVDMCGTNPGTGVASGTNDCFLTFLNANSAAAAIAGTPTTLDDGCTNMAAPGYGPSYGTWTAPAAGTYFIYLTEYDAAGTSACVANGANTVYDFSITVTPPPSVDGAITFDAIEYTRIVRSHVTGTLAMTGVARNLGSATITGATLGVSIATAAAPGTPIYTATSPAASITAGGSTNMTAGNWTPPAGAADYIVTYTLNVTGDGSTANNTYVRNLSFTTDRYARDAGVVTNGLGIGGPGVVRQGQTYNFLASGTISGVEFRYTGGQVGDTVQVEIYTMTGNTPSATPVATSPVATIATVGGGIATPGTLTVNFTTPFAAVAGTNYLVSVLHRARGTNIGLAYTDNIYILNRAFLQIDNGAWSTPATFGFFPAYTIRPIFGAGCNAPVFTTATYNCANNSVTVNFSSVGTGGPFTLTVGAQTQVLTTATSYTFTGLTPNQTYTASVANAGNACTAVFNGDIIPTCYTPAAGCTNLIVDGGLEQPAASVWTEVSTDGAGTPQTFPIVDPLNPLFGIQSAWFGGYGAGGSVTSLSQIVTFPAGASSAELTFWYNFGVCANTTDALVVRFNNVVVATITANAAQCGSGLWYFQTINLPTVLAGAANTVNLTFTEATANTTNTNLFVDGISLAVCSCPAITSTFATNNATCTASNGSATVTPAGGTAPYTYLWSTGATTASITNRPAGTYTVTITSANGCTGTGSATIGTTNANITATFTTNNATCAAANGSATATPAGGTTPYTYAWSTGATTASITGRTAGTYTVTITSANSCTGTASVTIGSTNTTLTVTTNTTAATCSSNGSATASTMMGSAPYTYAWSNGATTATISAGAGSYFVTITDSNGCTGTSTANISNPGAPSGTTQITNVACNGALTGAVNLTVNGGVAPYSYAWSNGATTQDLSNVAANAYSVTITDASNCVFVTSATVTQPTALLLTSGTPTNVACFGATTGTASVTVSGGTSPYNYAWSNGATNASITGLAAGAYNATVTDANGCTIGTSAAINVTQPAAALGVDFPSLVITNVSCFGGSNGGVSFTTIGGTAPYSYLWSNGATTSTLTGAPAGTYGGTITDANGCTYAAPIPLTISQPAAALAAAGVVTNENAGNDGAVDLTVTGGTSPYTYVWSNGATTEDISGLTAINVTVTVTDANGCTTSQSFSVLSGVTTIPGTELFEITPNPSTGQVFLNLELTTPAELTLDVMSMNGQVIFNRYVGTTDAVQMPLDLTALPAGVYTVRVSSVNGAMFKRLVIAK